MPGQEPDLREFSNDKNIALEELISLLISPASLDQKRKQQSLDSLTQKPLDINQLANLINVFKQDERQTTPPQYLPATERDKQQNGGSITPVPFDNKPGLPLGTKIAGNEIATAIAPWQFNKLLAGGSSVGAAKNLGLQELLQLLIPQLTKNYKDLPKTLLKQSNQEKFVNFMQ